MYFILLLVSLVAADIALLYPAREQVFRPDTDGNVQIQMIWIDDNSNPKVDNVDKYTIGLCTGPNSNITMIGIIDKDLDPKEATVEGKGNKRNWSYNVTVPDTFTDDGLYYLQVLSFFDKSSHFHIHYSQRFELEHMNHKGNTTFFHGPIEDPPLPDTETHGTASSSTQDLHQFYTIPYMLQSGSVKYAPMQETVDTTWETKRWSGKSSDRTAKPFKTIATKPNVEYTITEPPSYTLKTGQNLMPGTKTRLSHYDPKSRVKPPFLPEKTSDAEVSSK